MTSLPPLTLFVSFSRGMNSAHKTFMGQNITWT